MNPNWRDQEKANPLLETRSTNEVREKLVNLTDGARPAQNVDKKTEEQALKLIHKTMGMNTRVIRDIHDVETTYTVHPRETLVFQNCRDCKYTVLGQCAIIMVTDCHNFSLEVNASVRTHVMEVWRCKDLTLKLNTNIQTLQVDLSNNVDITYKTVKHFRDVVWSASEEVHLRFGDSEDHVDTGFSVAAPHYPDELKFEKAQFFIRYIDGMLRIERVLRLSNGFATTKRQHEQWKARQEKNAFDLAKKLGIKIGPKKPGMKMMNDQASPITLAQKSMGYQPNTSDVMKLFNAAV